MMIIFIAEYEDGSKDHFDVDRWTLRSGDYIASLRANANGTDA